MEMTAGELTKYLKQVSSLETSIYMQKSAIEEAKRQSDLLMPRQPVFNEIREPKEPLKKVLEPKTVPDRSKHWLVTILWLLGIGFGIFAIYEYDIWFPGLALIVLCALLAYIYADMHRVSNDARKSIIKYNSELPLLQREEDDKYEEALNKYKIEKESYEMYKNGEREKHKKALEIYTHNMNMAIAKMQGACFRAERILEKYYEKNVIFGKYRNLVAMTTMYEYFASGRCNELTGPNGAYNLYESELRQNIIIGELSAINSNLEQIKSNQYVLYTELKRGNETQRKVLSGIMVLSRTVDQIADSSAINAYCAQIDLQLQAAQTALLL